MRVIEAGEIASGVTLEAFKHSVHLSMEDMDDDAALLLSLSAAEQAVAVATGRPLTPRAVEFIVPLGAWRQWWFPVLPVVELIGLAVDDGAGYWLDKPMAGAWVRQSHDEPQLVLSAAWDGHKAGAELLRVQARVGGPNPTTDAQVRQAVILLAKEWFEAGIAIDQQDAPRLSFGVHRLIRQVRYRRPVEVQ
ncbi:MAG: hypothetical protein MRY77_10100 [Rhodobacteraceae bacterium]|nr:hypothetical protein [Paracoccaceae bacterium]